MKSVNELKKLDIKKRINIWAELWSSIIGDADIPVTKEEKELLDRRYRAFKKNPSSGTPWDEIYNDLKSSS